MKSGLVHVPAGATEPLIVPMSRRFLPTALPGWWGSPEGSEGETLAQPWRRTNALLWPRLRCKRQVTAVDAEAPARSNPGGGRRSGTLTPRRLSALVGNMEAEPSALVRRVTLFGVPSLYVVLGFMHPTSNPEVGDDPAFFIWLHIAQLFLIGGLACVLWLLVDGLKSRAATIARALILPFVIVYTALDSVLGIAWGVAAETANGLPVADQDEASRFIEALLEPTARGYLLYFGAGLLWLAVALATVVALRGSAPWPALVLMASGAIVWALGHAPPMGPIGMALFLAGIVWLELRPGLGEAEPDALRQGV